MLGEADVLAASVDLLGGSCRSRRRGTTEVHAFHGVLLLYVGKNYDESRKLLPTFK